MPRALPCGGEAVTEALEGLRAKWRSYAASWPLESAEAGSS